MNPMQLIQMLRSGQNPQQLAMNLLESQMGETPMGQNLLNLAKNGRSADIEHSWLDLKDSDPLGSESFKSSQEWSIRRY